MVTHHPPIPQMHLVLAYNDCDWMQEKNIGASALVVVGGAWVNNDLLTGGFANDGVSSQTYFRVYLGACLILMIVTTLRE